MKKLKIKTLDDDWYDSDELMLHAIMQILVDYMEKENPDEHIDWTSDEEHERAWHKLNFVYNWWTIDRPARHNPANDIEWDDDWFGGNMPEEVKKIILNGMELEKKWYREDTEMMQVVISIREYMWT